MISDIFVVCFDLIELKYLVPNVFVCCIVIFMWFNLENSHADLKIT